MATTRPDTEPLDTAIANIDAYLASMPPVPYRAGIVTDVLSMTMTAFGTYETLEFADRAQSYGWTNLGKQVVQTTHDLRRALNGEEVEGVQVETRPASEIANEPVHRPLSSEGPFQLGMTLDEILATGESVLANLRSMRERQASLEDQRITHANDYATVVVNGHGLLLDVEFSNLATRSDLTSVAEGLRHLLNADEPTDDQE